jgi:hypothetical protein
MTSFSVSAEDLAHIARIVERAEALGAFRSGHYPAIACRMDLTACHANGCPLDLERLAGADDFNLIHDVLGIAGHIDRDTGELDRRFLPRFAK